MVGDFEVRPIVVYADDGGDAVIGQCKIEALPDGSCRVSGFLVNNEWVKERLYDIGIPNDYARWPCPW